MFDEGRHFLTIVRDRKSGGSIGNYVQVEGSLQQIATRCRDIVRVVLTVGS